MSYEKPDWTGLRIDDVFMLEHDKTLVRVKVKAVYSARDEMEIEFIEGPRDGERLIISRKLP